MKEKKEKRLWGPMKGEPNERGQTDDSPNLIRKACCKVQVKEPLTKLGGLPSNL